MLASRRLRPRESRRRQGLGEEPLQKGLGRKTALQEERVSGGEGVQVVGQTGLEDGATGTSQEEASAAHAGGRPG